MVITKGKFYNTGKRKCIVGHPFECMGVWQHRILFLNKNGYITGQSEVLTNQPNWSEIDPIKIKRRDKYMLEEIFEVPVGFYSYPNKNRNCIPEKQEVIERYIK